MIGGRLTSKKGLGRAGSGKRMVVKPLKRAVSLPDGFEEDTWAKLKAGIEAVHTMTPCTYSKEELYRGVESMCVHKMAPKLYERVESACVEHVKKLVDGLEGHTEDMAAFLQSVLQLWNDHCQQMLIIQNIFLYLDRTYVLQTSSVVSLKTMGLNALSSKLESDIALLTKLVDGLLHHIERLRNGETIEKSTISSLTRMLSALGLYHHFEMRFLEESRTFYAAEGLRYIEMVEVPKYLARVETRIEEERSLGISLLHHDTRRPLLTLLDEVMVRQHVPVLIEKGFTSLCAERRTDSLRLMYKLFAKVDRLDDLKAAFTAFLNEKGLAIVNDKENEKTMVDSLLKLRNLADSLFAEAFMSHDSFGYAIKQSFEKIVNSRDTKPVELIAKYADGLLRKGKGSTEDEIDATLGRLMVLFRAIFGKDVFEAFYKKDLAKRLLLGRSASADLERNMLARLKTECGSGFTAKLEGMFKDIELTKDFMSQFTAARSSREPRLDMYVHVLTTTYWPNYTAMEVKLPPQLHAAQEEFSKFYGQKYSDKRTLTWQHSLGHCLLRAAFPKGRKELAVSLFQTMVLLLFNEKSTWTYPEIKERTGIEEGELKRTLISLACGKVRVILKAPKSREVDPGDSFTFNAKFDAKMFRLKINTIQMKETKEESEATYERIFQERQYQVDAAIVRIMKTRKSLRHQQLISELVPQLKFAAKMPDLKRRIKSLIDREYIERDEEDSNVYHYVA